MIVYNTTDKTFKHIDTNPKQPWARCTWTMTAPGEGICDEAYPELAKMLIEFCEEFG